MSKVSIIIPAYNQARFLAQAIDSCLAQTYPELEVVVVDDGSTDATPEMAARYESRIRYVRQENTGLPGARNRGIIESTGTYLCFLDSDDLYLPTKIESQATLLDEDPNLGFVYCDIATIDEDGQPLPEAPAIAQVNRPLSGDIFQSLMMGGYFPPHTVMIRRSVLDQVGVFDPALGGHADYDLWLRVSGSGYLASFLNDKLASYRVYPTSMSKDGEHMAETRKATLRKMAEHYPSRIAEALDRLQQSNEDLFQANQWMKANWERVLSDLEAGTGPGSDADLTEGRERFAFLQHLNQAVMTKGQPEQKEIWDVTLDDQMNQALLLQPPAELAFVLPTALAGQLITAVAIHPDALTKPGAGGCEFRLRINGRQAYAIALDPLRFSGDRSWHPVRLQLPANPAGPHKVVLETRSLGGSDNFRWALWRCPEFKWKAAEEQAPTELKLTLNAA